MEVFIKWFKHQSDANMNAKLQELLLDYGLEGYGLYWYCLELIATNVAGEKLTFELEHDARVIARNTGSSVQKVQEIMNRLIELNLFEESEGNIFCLKLAKRCDDFTAKAIRSNNQKSLKIQSLRQSPTKTDKVPLEEEEEVRIEEEQKKNIKTHGSSNDKPSPKKSDEDFEYAWSQYPKREGANPKNKALSAWNARRKEGVEADAMINGVFRYNTFCASKGQTNTSFVMQASRFFGKELNFENNWSINHEANQRTNTGRPMSAVERVTAANRAPNEFEQERYPGAMDIDGEFIRT